MKTDCHLKSGHVLLFASCYDKFLSCSSLTKAEAFIQSLSTQLLFLKINIYSLNYFILGYNLVLSI